MKYDITFLDLTRFPDANGNYGRRPLSYRLLAGYLALHGYSSAVYTGSLVAFRRDVAGLFSQHSIKLVGLYCDYDNQSEVESGIQVIRSVSSVPVIVGGPQSWALSEDFLTRTGCNFIALGEAEQTLLLLLNSLAEGNPFPTSVPGLLLFDRDGVGCFTGTPIKVKDLDDIPPFHQITELNDLSPTDTLQVVSSRGCPYRCAYCHESSSAVRYRSVPHVVSEIESALEANPGIHKVFFVDNTSTLRPKRVRALCDALQRLRTRWDFVWGCESHIHFIDRDAELLNRMVETGLVRLQIGIESGNSDMLLRYRKAITPKDALRAVQAACTAGVPLIKTNFILGGPDETWETVEDSLQLAKALLDEAPGRMEITCSFLAPYPLSDISRNPSLYRMRIVDRESLSCFDSMTVPVIESVDMSLADLDAAMIYFSKELHAYMLKNLIALQKSDIDRISTLYYRYGVGGPWMSLLRENGARARFFDLIHLDHAVPAYDFKSVDDLLHLRPVRTIELYNSAASGQLIAGIELNQLALQFLRYSTGKSTTAEVRTKLEELSDNTTLDPLDLTCLINRLTEEYLLVFMNL